jgi:hypothetical protein
MVYNWITGVQWLRLALSKAPNRIGVSPHLRAETDPVSETSCLFFFLVVIRIRTMDKVRNPSNWGFGLDYFTDMSTESAVFWDLTPCSPIEVHRRFREMSCLHIHDRKASKAELIICILLFLLGLLFDLEGSAFFRNVRNTPQNTVNWCSQRFL